ncbi:MAG: TIGR00266 family protein [Chitinophagales bacterium]|nr:TIGR00266 family protein [Chitinophagales bacterium]
MKFEIIEKGAFAALKVSLQAGEAVKAESGAMVSKDTSIEIEGKMEGGLLGGLGRMLAGETLFLQTLRAGTTSGDVILAPTMTGDIIEIDLDGNTVWNVAKDGFFAGDIGLDISTKMQNLAKGLFSGEGFFVVKISGKGKLFVSSFGSVIKVNIDAGKEYVVDNHHLVAWPENAQIKIEKAAKGWLNSIKSGEGLVTKISGPTEIYIQTRNAYAFGNWMGGFLPLKK